MYACIYPSLYDHIYIYLSTYASMYAWLCVCENRMPNKPNQREWISFKNQTLAWLATIGVILETLCRPGNRKQASH